jgi:hypothetical protein
LLLAAIKLLWPHRRLPAWRWAVVLIIGGAIVGTLVDGW